MGQLGSTFDKATDKASEKIHQAVSREPHEGKITKTVEKVTAQVPSIGFLGLAVGSMMVSAGLALAGKRELANFVGLWAPSLLLIGVYNKLVKVEGHD
jgi:hypothetical protein